MGNSDRLESRARPRQLNLSFGARSALLDRLLEAERLTGRSPTQIVREIADTYLDIWLLSRRVERQAISRIRGELVRRLRPHSG